MSGFNRKQKIKKLNEIIDWVEDKIEIQFLELIKFDGSYFNEPKDLLVQFTELTNEDTFNFLGYSSINFEHLINKVCVNGKFCQKKFDKIDEPLIAKEGLIEVIDIKGNLVFLFELTIYIGHEEHIVDLQSILRQEMIETAKSKPKISKNQ